jgi:hypothetical protein
VRPPSKPRKAAKRPVRSTPPKPSAETARTDDRGAKENTEEK